MKLRENEKKHRRRHNEGRKSPIAKWDSAMQKLDNYMKQLEAEEKAAREAARKEKESKK